MKKLVAGMFLTLMLFSGCSKSTSSSRPETETTTEESITLIETTAVTEPEGITTSDDTEYVLNDMTFTIPKGWTYEEYADGSGLSLESPNKFSVHICYSEKSVEEEKREAIKIMSDLDSVGMVFGDNDYTETTVGNKQGERNIFTYSGNGILITYESIIVQNHKFTYGISCVTYSTDDDTIEDAAMFSDTIIPSIIFR